MKELTPAFYEALFELSPISIWVEDFSRVIDTINELKQRGISDIRAYYQTYPADFAACVSKLKVVDVNKATLSLYKASSKEDLLSNLDKTFMGESAACILESIVALSEGKKSFSGNGVNYNLHGEKLTIRVSWNLDAHQHEDFSKVIVVIQDLTELAHMKDISESRGVLFRAVFEQSSEGMLLADGNGIVLLVNEIFQKLCGLSGEQIVGRPVWELYEDLFEHMRIQDDKVLDESFFSGVFTDSFGYNHSCEYSFRDSQNKTHYHKLNVFPIQNTDDATFAVITTDLTAVYRSAEITRLLHTISHAVNTDSSLNELYGTIHQSLGRLIDATNFYIALYDHKTNLISFPYHVDECSQDSSPIEADNKSSLTAQIISEAQSLLLDEEAINERIATNQAIGAASKNYLGVPLMLSNQVIGAMVVQSYNYNNLYDADDMILMESISEQIAFALRKKQSDENVLTMIQAIEQAGEGIIILSPEGYIRYVNTVFEKSTGYRRIEIIDQAFEDLPFDKSDGSNWDQSWSRVKSYHPWRGKLDFLRKDGTKLTLDMIMKPVIDEDNRLSSIIASCKDVTYELLREEQLKKTQRLEAIGRLTGGIAHDFNNVLSAIIGYTELANDDVDPNSMIASNLSEVLKSAIRAKEMISQLLAFSRQEESKTEVIELIDHVKESMRFLKSFLPKSIKIKETYLAERSTAMAVSGQIHQIIINLGTNAMHAIKNSDGVIEVRVEPHSFTSKEMILFPELNQCHYILISLSDNGCGIEEAQLSRIFDPYFTTKGANEGTGLGLSIVHGIVSSHNGAVRVESEVGKGTTFKVYLPLYEAGDWQPKNEEYTDDVIPGGEETIMFVDDEPMLVNIFRQGLSRLGYRVECFIDPRKAKEYFEANSHRVDLIVTDTTMPYVNGLDLALWAIKHKPGIPVILCTGFTTLVSAEEARKKGISDFIMKPFKIRDMAMSIRNILDEQADAN